MSVKSTDHVVAEMLQREAFQAMTQLWGPLQKLRRRIERLRKGENASEERLRALVTIIEEMEKILCP